MTKREKLNMLQEYYDEALELTDASRDEGRLVYEYLRGNQLPDDVKLILNSRGQPLRWENIILEMDTSIGGIMRMARKQIQVTSRSNRDPEAARVRQAVHQSTLDSTEWWSKKAEADRDMRLFGLAVIESRLVPLHEYDATGEPLYEIRDDRIPAVESLIDMYSRQPDYSDARYFHHSRLYDKRTIQRIYGKKAENLTEDERGMVRIVRTWYREGDQIRIAIWSEDTLLEDKPQPYTRTKGRFSVSVRRRDRSHIKEYYGIYRDILPLQDDINNSMLRVKNMLGSIKVIIESSGVDDIESFMEQFSQDNSVTEVNDGTLTQKRMEVINLANNIAQLLQIVQDTRQRARQILGISPELLGTSTTRQSGVAIQLKQNAGLVGFQRLLSASNELDIDVFEIHSAIMEEHFNAETVFEIMGPDGKPEHFWLNEYERDEHGRIIWEDGMPKRKNILSTGRYSYTIVDLPYNDGSPDTKMKAWGEIMKAVPQKYAAAALPVIMQDMGSPQAERMTQIMEQVDRAEAEAAQASQGQDPQMQQISLQLQEMAAKVAELQSKAMLNQAKAQEIAAKIPNNSGGKCPSQEGGDGERQTGAPVDEFGLQSVGRSAGG